MNTFKELIQGLSLDEDSIWNPQFSLHQLIGQRKKPNKAARESGQRLTMTNLCKVASKIWEHCPQELRAKYHNLALETANLHAKDFP
ncbi:36960_t:CDS:2, partial [Gigaspora margarita]